MAKRKIYRRSVFDIHHIGMHSHIPVLNPATRSAPPPTLGGLPFGYTQDAGAAVLNQLEQHQGQLVGGTSGLIIGYRGAGKTATLKKMAMHESTLINYLTGQRRRVVVEDTRLNIDAEGNEVSEYKELVESLGAEHVDLSGYKINFLDHRFGLDPAKQHGLLLALCEVVKGQRLNQAEKVALSVAISVMRTEAPKHTSLPLLQQIMARLTFSDYNLHSDVHRDEVLEMIEDDEERGTMKRRLDASLNLENRVFTGAAHSVAFLISTLLSGYDGIFGTEHQLFDVLTRPVVGLDLTRLDSNTTIPMAEMALWAIRTGARGIDIAADFEIHDENWSRWSSLIYGEYMIEHLKHIRGRGTRIWRAMHRPSDIKRAGDERSDEYKLAEMSLRETDVVLIGRTPRAEHDLLQDTFRRIPKPYLDMLPTLAPGQFLVLIGDSWHPFMMQVDLTSLQMQIGHTDYARDLQLRRSSLASRREEE